MPEELTTRKKRPTTVPGRTERLSSSSPKPSTSSGIQQDASGPLAKKLSRLDAGDNPSSSGAQ